MKCQNCNSNSAKYIQRSTDRELRFKAGSIDGLEKRTDFRAKCRKCKAISEVKP